MAKVSGRQSMLDEDCRHDFLERYCAYVVAELKALSDIDGRPIFVYTTTGRSCRRAGFSNYATNLNEPA